MAKAKKLNYVFTVGKRKSAVARVRLFLGKGVSTVNGQLIQDYFPGALSQEKYLLPFRVTETKEKYYVTVKVVGGGKGGQLDATVSGIAKALAKAKQDTFRAPLKKLGLLTRDSRVRQRRMVGMGGKSRRRKQSPKR